MDLNKYKDLLSNPDRFFGSVKKDRSILRPFLFYAVVMGIFYLTSLVTSLIGQAIFAGLAGGQPIRMIVMTIISGFVGFMIALISIFIGAGILHLFILMLGGKGDYVQTFKLSCYAVVPFLFLAGLTLFTIISLLGQILLVLGLIAAIIIQLILEVKGARVLHDMSTGNAVIAIVLIPLALGFILFILIAVLFILGLGAL
ncbi:MAG: Yip1 family protein [Candidatus Woesearchaeota archaeon]